MNIKSLALSGAVLLGTLAVSVAPAYAAVDRAFVEGIGSGSDLSHVSEYVHYMNGATSSDVQVFDLSLAGVNSEQDLLDLASSTLQTYATNQGYTLSNGVIWSFVSPSLVNARIAAAVAGITQPQAMSFATTTRSLNSAFQVSTTRASFVSYTVDVASTITLSGGQTGTVSLQYADDSGFTTNVKTIQSSVNGNTGTLSVGLSLTQTASAALTGMIPAGKYVKITTANTTGTPTFTFRAAQEVLMPSN